MTVEVIVIHRLSRMPSWIESQREVKSGGKNEAIKRWPRNAPSATRFQSTSMVPKANAR